jgi:hypothetical protein
MRRRSLLHLAFAAAFTLVGASCLSPTLPLPPPVTDSILEAENGVWTISGTCIEGALVTVFNETQGQGVVVEDRDQTGRFVVKLKATLCDVGWASQQVGLNVSPMEPFVVEPLSLNSARLSAACH